MLLPQPSTTSPIDPPIHQAPVLFGTRRRTPPIPGLSGIRTLAGVQPCPTLRALLAHQGGDQRW
ncbi:MAG TPA: hypothetical protein VFX16_00840 [Pseudonocardiaceae bacterium]|nr:hypothetical protein [Pseudonocardiaceae bacterium]